MIELVLVGLAGLCLLGVAVEHGRRFADELEHRRHERQRHAALMRELGRHP